MNRIQAPTPDTAFGDSPAGSSTDAILIVDDGQQRLRDARVALEQAGCRVLYSQSAGEAFALFVRERAAVLMMDEAILNANGTDFVHQVRLLDPAIQIILQSGPRDARQRRGLVVDLGLHSVHAVGDGPEHLLEMVASALSVTRRLEQTRADQELRGLILAKLCHNLRTSMHVIHGYTEILRGDVSASPTEDILARLSRASEGALDLIQSYLDLACLEAPGVVVRRELVSVDELVKELCVEAVRLVGSRPVRVRCAFASRGLFIRTDGEKLRAILNELLANAVKFTPGGEVEVAVEFPPGGTEFILRDSGPGLDQSDLPLLFRAFRQRRGDAMATTPGQGIGLAVVRRLSALIGARLTATRNAKGGAMFTLSLPGDAIVQPAGIPMTMH
jgi:signal transduction histidine kinase